MSLARMWWWWSRGSCYLGLDQERGGLVEAFRQVAERSIGIKRLRGEERRVFALLLLGGDELHGGLQLSGEVRPGRAHIKGDGEGGGRCEVLDEGQERIPACA